MTPPTKKALGHKNSLNLIRYKTTKFTIREKIWGYMPDIITITGNKSELEFDGIITLVITDSEDIK